MPINLEALARAQGVRRSRPLPNIVPTKAQRDQLRGIYLQVVTAWINGATARLLPEYRATVVTDALRATFDRHETASQATLKAMMEHGGGDGAIQAARDSVARQTKRLVADSIPEYESKEAALAHEVEVLVANLTITGGALDVWAAGVERWHRNRVISGALSAARVDLSTMLSPFDVRQTVQEALAWNTSLIRNVSDDMRQRLANVFFAGFRAGTPPRTLGREIAEVAGIGRRRANNIAADQTTKLSAALDRARQAGMGLEEWVWRSSHKVNYRPEHLARDGKHYANSAAEAQRIGVRPPPSDLPGELINCGCTRQAWLRLDGEAVTAQQVG